MTARRRSANRKYLGGSGIIGGSEEKKELPVRDSCPEAASGPSPAGGMPKSPGSLPLAVILEVIAREYRDTRDEALCRVALRLAEKSGQIGSYRARWDQEETDPAIHASALIFDRNQCLELINYYKNKNNLDKLQETEKKLAQIEGRLLLGEGAPTRITSEDLNRLEQFIKESGF